MSAPYSLESSLDPYPLMMIYGPAGVGKTALAGGSQYLRTLVLDVDQGVDTLRSVKTSELLMANGLPGIRRDLIQIKPIHNYADFEDALKWVEHRQDTYDLVVLDSVTELQKLVRKHYMEKQKTLIADQRIWGFVLDALDFTTIFFRNLRKQSIFIAHEHQGKPDPETGIMRWEPNFRGQFSDDYARHFSVIMRYTMKFNTQVDAQGQVAQQLVRYLVCRRDPFNEAKDRYSALDQYEVPSLDNIMSKIYYAVYPQTAAPAA